MLDSPIAHAADALLQRRGYRLDLWLADAFEAGKTNRQIAADLADVTDDVVQVSHEAIRRWRKQLEPAA